MILYIRKMQKGTQGKRALFKKGYGMRMWMWDKEENVA